MNEKALKEIDFYRIRDDVAGFCVSEESKQVLLQRNPFTKVSEVEQLKNLSREWSLILNSARRHSVTAWEPIHHLYAIIHTNGAALSLPQVYALAQFCVSVANVKTAVSNCKTELSLKYLPQQIEKLSDFSETEKKLFRVITPDGELRDLPEISAIRKQIASLNAKLKNIMKTFTSDQKLQDVLESNVPVLRNGRQVLAVKSSCQNRIPGIVYEVSQSGRTVYIEPEESVKCTNELVQKENELQVVIKKILTELTFDLQPSIPLFKASLPVMELLDSTCAAAKWGRENNCIFADTCNPFKDDDQPPCLIKARHPLLGEKAVPIDIRFMSGKRVLIITGPNTGGKTVSLKTFALLSMLNQAGFPIPASDGTRLPVFSDIFADIGDDQSLDQSLSTFSGHMKNISQALSGAKSDTLILLDELGSGTDPQEGTAISMAVLDELIKKKSFVLVTTHQGILKNYGYTNPCCINASVEFNQDTLSPSYNLIMGVPGESHALDIAKKSGLPENICAAARNYIATEQADVSALIRGLNRKHVELNKIQKEAERRASDAEDKFNRLKEREIGLRKKEHEIKLGKTQELNDFLIHSRRTLENLVRTLKEGEISREKTLGVKQFISDLTEQTQRLEEKIEAEEEKIKREEKAFENQLKEKKHPSSSKKTKKKISNSEALKNAEPHFIEGLKKPVESGENEVLEFKPGASVKAGVAQNEGVIIDAAGKGKWQVQFGSVKMVIKEKNLVLVRAKKTETAVQKVSYSLETEGETERPVFELRLLGMRGEEAVRALEKQIDLAALNNLQHFSVIHGKGDGVLMQLVRDYLSHSPLVSDFETAPAEDGGAGKTYVTLK